MMPRMTARATRVALCVTLLGLGVVVAWQVRHRMSSAVRGWSADTREPAPGGPLYATQTTGHPDEPVILFLHGITASGISFGSAYDALPADLLVPDLLGFGRSMDLPTDGYTVRDHVDAVVATVASSGLAHRPMLIVGHSMGAVLALHVAEAIEHTIGVIAMSAPLYDSEAEGLEHIGEADPLAGLLATGDLAQRVCGWMCDHRQLAGATWPLLAPHWPVPVARDGVLHTWTSYRGSLQSLILDSGYHDALAVLDDRGVPLLLLNGTADGVPVSGRAAELAARSTNIRFATVDGATHSLPLSHPSACVTAIKERLAVWG